MAYTKNILGFSGAAQSDLVESYRLLVVFELALKDANFGTKGHDVPGMLATAALKPFTGPLNAQLASYSTMLTNALRAITCQSISGTPTQVPPKQYPYIRYCRFSGDWGGMQETAQALIEDLLDTCNKINAFLRANKAAIGIML